jgi:hypothetical protein
VEDDLGVGRSLDIGEQLGIDRQHQIPPQLVEVGDEAVVHEQPVVAAERMAVGLLDGRADRGPHVRHEQGRLDVRGKLAEVGVAPGGRHAAIDARSLAGPVPAEPEPVAVGGLRAHARVEALIHDPVGALEEQLLDQHRLAQPRHPTTHREPP